MPDFMGDMDTWQWIVLAIAGVAFLWPRRQAIMAKLPSFSSAATVDANSIAANYQALIPYLSDDTAAKVRAEVTEVFLTTLPAVVTGTAKAGGEAVILGSLLEVLQKLATANIPVAPKPKRAK